MSAPPHAGRLFVQCPRGGALLMNLIGSCGNFAIAMILPFMDSRLDQAGPGAAMQSVSAPAIILVAIFGSLLLYFRARGGYAPVTLSTARTGGSAAMSRCPSGIDNGAGPAAAAGIARRATVTRRSGRTWGTRERSTTIRPGP